MVDDAWVWPGVETDFMMCEPWQAIQRKEEEKSITVDGRNPGPPGMYLQG